MIRRRARGRAGLLEHLALAAAGFGVAWLLVAFVIFPDTGPAITVPVPAVLGLPYADASRRLSDAGLKPALGERRLSGEAPSSTVLSQTPAAGAQVSRGAQVILDVSAGQQRATIPALAGRGQVQAERLLREAGLDVGQVTERADPSPRGTVLGLQPAAGQVVPAGTAVQLVVSSGPAELVMPDLLGRSLSEARGTIEQLGLALGELRRDSTRAGPPGRIVQQVPAAGTPISPGATVTLTVSGNP